MVAIRMAKDPRSLSDEESDLWNQVVDTAVPLRRKQPHPNGPVKNQRPLQTSSPADAPRGGPSHGVPADRNLGQIDRRTVRRIARGSITLDGRLDLHGLTQAQAHGRLTDFVNDAQENGLRTVLVITGKGVGDGTERGVLKRALPQWLSTPPLRNLVLGFEIAHREHGGAGAFYVRLRRPRG